jgi:putative intracellular protease/amidase
MKELLVYVYDTCVITEVSLLTWWVAEEEDFVVRTISETLDPIKTTEGFIINPEIKIEDVNDTDDIVGLVFPGGYDISLSEPLGEFVRILFMQKKILGAICAGPTFLGYAGVLKDKKFITTRAPEDFKELGVPDPFNWNNKQSNEVRVVRDKNIITATGAAFTDFADIVFEALGLYRGEEDRKTILDDFTPQWKY